MFVGALLGGVFGIAALAFCTAVFFDGDWFGMALFEAAFRLEAIVFGALAGAVYGFILSGKLGSKVPPNARRAALVFCSHLPFWVAAGAGMYAYAQGAGQEPPADALLQEFARKEPMLNRLMNMTRENPTLKFVGPDRVDVRNEELSSARVGQYRSIMRSAGIMFIDVKENREVWFTKWGQGCAACTDFEKGFAYAPTPPKTLVPDLDREVPKHQERSFTLYQHIEGPWYLFYDQLD